MDHDHAAGVDLHLVAGAGDDAGRAGRDALHDDDLVAAQALDGVVDGDAGVEVAAGAVDLDGDVALALDGREILHEALGSDIEAGLGLTRPPVHRLTGDDIAIEDDLAESSLTLAMFQNFVGVCWTTPAPAHRRGVLLVFMLVLVSFLDGLFHFGDDGSAPHGSREGCAGH